MYSGNIFASEGVAKRREFSLIRSGMSRKYPYPINLIVDMDGKFGELRIPSFDPDMLPKDFLASVEYVLSTMPRTEADIIRLAYEGKDGVLLSSRKIAAEIGLSIGRTRDLFRSALLRLWERETWEILTKGVRGYIQHLKNERDSIPDELPSDRDRFAEITIADMCLPVHEHHILTRSGYKTVADVLAAGPEEVRKKRNCGEKAFRIIMAKLEEYGADTTSWQGWIKISY